MTLALPRHGPCLYVLLMDSAAASTPRGVCFNGTVRMGPDVAGQSKAEAVYVQGPIGAYRVKAEHEQGVLCNVWILGQVGQAAVPALRDLLSPNEVP